MVRLRSFQKINSQILSGVRHIQINSIKNESISNEADEILSCNADPSPEECQPSTLPETAAEAGGEHALDQFDEQYDPFGVGGDEYEPLESAIF